ncbi:MAG: N utilization substance protein B-like protein [Parcubacteria group bacterium GW2011_GWB1_44_7]|nr:MAG: N utilization substance protein B-like protein [Parcubacteria group bacterium GW2011_GWB1_44_7]
MANRHLARSIVLQSLFEWDFAQKSDSEAKQILQQNLAEFAPNMDEHSFADSLFLNIIKKRADLDSVISKAAPDWPLDKISCADRNVLRVGLYELLFAKRAEVPAKVAINEAIELAKTYGGENSGRFVNGVMGSIYKELGEPGKDETTTKKIIDPMKFPVERLGGALVFSRHEGEIYIALVHDIFGHWTLSKGKIGDRSEISEESAEEGTKREIKEELGLDIVIKESLGKNEYVASHPEKGKIRKQVTYFLAEAPFTDIKLEQKGGLDDGRWFRLRDIIDLNFYNDILPIVTKGVNLLLGNNK